MVELIDCISQDENFLDELKWILHHDYNDIYYGSDPELSCLIHKGAASSSKPNAVPVAVDSDDDGLIGLISESVKYHPGIGGL